jgi:hypothetical protein
MALELTAWGYFRAGSAFWIKRVGPLGAAQLLNMVVLRPAG